MGLTWSSLSRPRALPTRNGRLPYGLDGKHFVVKARGKRSVALSLSSEEGKEVARRLCLSADVVISNMRPGAMVRLGLDYDTLRAEKPSIIYGEVDGFGPAGAKAGKACVDLVAQAYGGLMASVAATSDLHFDRQQLFCDYTAGMTLAFAVAGALFHRERTGEGQRVSTSLTAAALMLQHRTASVMVDHEPERQDLAADRSEGRLGFDEAFARREELGGRMPSTYGTFRTTDGWIAIGGLLHHVSKLTELLGIDELHRSGFPNDDDVVAAIAQWSTNDLVAAIEQLGIPVAEVRLQEEVLLDPDMEAAGLVDELAHPRIGAIRMPAAPARFSSLRYEARPDTPMLGQHTVEELTELGYDQATIKRLVDDGIIVA